MPLIQDINERRYARARRRRRIKLEAQRQDTRAAFSIVTTPLEGLENLPKEYVNRGLLIRVNQKIANEIAAGRSEWPEETQESRFGFKGNDQGIVNTAYYAAHVEARLNPRTYPPHPCKRYVNGRWIDLAREDIARQQRQAGG